MPNSQCDQIEASLEAAVRGFLREGRRVRRRRENGWEFRLLFARLGFDFAELDELAAASAGSALSAALRERLMERLDAERRRLKRLARSGSARYDAGRHLAVHAAMRWLADADETGAAETDRGLPGALLNARFRRRSPRGGTPAARSAPPVAA